MLEPGKVTQVRLPYLAGGFVDMSCASLVNQLIICLPPNQPIVAGLCGHFLGTGPTTQWRHLAPCPGLAYISGLPGHLASWLCTEQQKKLVAVTLPSEMHYVSTPLIFQQQVKARFFAWDFKRGEV